MLLQKTKGQTTYVQTFFEHCIIRLWIVVTAADGKLVQRCSEVGRSWTWSDDACSPQVSALVNDAMGILHSLVFYQSPGSR